MPTLCLKSLVTHLVLLLSSSFVVNIHLPSNKYYIMRNFIIFITFWLFILSSSLFIACFHCFESLELTEVLMLLFISLFYLFSIIFCLFVLLLLLLFMIHTFYKSTRKNNLIKLIYTVILMRLYVGYHIMIYT